MANDNYPRYLALRDAHVLVYARSHSTIVEAYIVPLARVLHTSPRKGEVSLKDGNDTDVPGKEPYGKLGRQNRDTLFREELYPILDATSMMIANHCVFAPGTILDF